MLYVSKVAAIQWKGDNLPEVQAFLEKYVGEPAALSARNEPATFWLGDEPTDYNDLLFYAWHDDQEVEEGYWIVVFLGGEPDGEIVHSNDFNGRYKPDAR